MADRWFDEALRRGFPFVWIVHIHGLPWVWTEVVPKRTTSTAPIGLPAGFLGACPALLLEDRATFGVEADSQSGVARGDALTFQLAWEPLERDGLTTTVFRRPSKRSRLTADAIADATSFTVDSSDGWVAGDLAFIGKECLRVGSVVDANTLGTLERGIAGKADLYSSLVPSSFADVTDRPTIYRGRRIDVYRHILSPEGRFMQSAWMETHSLTRLEWMGTLDEEPRAGAFGLQFRSLPLHRLAANDLGYELAMRVITPAISKDQPTTWWRFPIVVSPGSSITLRGSYSGPTSGTFDITIGTYAAEAATIIEYWAGDLTSELIAALASEPWFSTGGLSFSYVDSSNVQPADYLSIWLRYASGYTMGRIECVVLPVPQLYWLRPNVYVATNNTEWDIIHFADRIKVDFRAPPGAWLVVQQTEGEGWQDLVIPATGTAVLEGGDRTELIRWDRREQPSPAPDPRWVLLHITERGAAGTSMVDLEAAADAELKFVTGHAGTPSVVLLTLLQSSGAGNRGTYDTLAVGLGLGVEEDAIDVPTIRDDPDLGVFPIAAFASGRTSIAKLLGGWLALHGKCLVMRPVVDPITGVDRMKLTIVELTPVVFGPTTPSLERADVELSGVGFPEPAMSPNEISIETAGIRGAAPPVIVQDRVAIQAAGTRTLDVSAPGISAALARALGGTRIAAGLGNELVQISVLPGVRLWVGDTLVLQIGHPATYHWGTGQRGPAAIAACVVGDAPGVDGRRKLVLLMAGVIAEGVYLAPTFRLEWVSGPDLEITPNWPITLSHIGPPDTPVQIRLYNPGVPTQNETFEAIFADSTILTLTAGPPPAWVDAATTRLTMGNLGTGDPESEPQYLFQSKARRWSP